MAIEVNGKSFETDEEGYLANLNDWEKDVATVMAKEDDIELSDDHWEIINFLREYYEEYQIAPAVRVLTKAVGKKLGKDKVHEFRRSWDIKPDPLSKKSPYHPINIEIYKGIPKEIIPDSSDKTAASLGFLASNRSATLGNPPVISLVFEATNGILVMTSPAVIF